jgi:hypothetical protein
MPDDIENLKDFSYTIPVRLVFTKVSRTKEHNYRFTPKIKFMLNEVKETTINMDVSYLKESTMHFLKKHIKNNFISFIRKNKRALRDALFSKY